MAIELTHRKINIAFIIDKTKDLEYIAITNNHGKILLKSYYLSNNFCGLERGFFIQYEFLNMNNDLSLLNFKKSYKPDNVTLINVCEEFTNEFNGFVNLILFICKYFVYEGFCTSEILLNLSFLKNKNMNIKDINIENKDEINKIFILSIFNILEICIDSKININSEKILDEDYIKKELISVFYKTKQSNNIKLLKKYILMVNYIFYL